MAEEVRLFGLSFTARGRADLTKALLFLDTIGLDVAERFNDRLMETLIRLRQSIAEEIVIHGIPAGRLHEDASVFFGRPMFRIEVQTGKTRSRRSSAGLWYVYYALRDEVGEGVPNVYRIRSVCTRFSIALPRPSLSKIMMTTPEVSKSICLWLLNSDEVIPNRNIFTNYVSII